MLSPEPRKAVIPVPETSMHGQFGAVLDGIKSFKNRPRISQRSDSVILNLKSDAEIIEPIRQEREIENAKGIWEHHDELVKDDDRDIPFQVRLWASKSKVDLAQSYRKLFGFFGITHESLLNIKQLDNELDTVLNNLIRNLLPMLKGMFRDLHGIELKTPQELENALSNPEYEDVMDKFLDDRLKSFHTHHSRPPAVVLSGSPGLASSISPRSDRDRNRSPTLAPAAMVPAAGSRRASIVPQQQGKEKEMDSYDLDNLGCCVTCGRPVLANLKPISPREVSRKMIASLDEVNDRLKFSDKQVDFLRDQLVRRNHRVGSLQRSYLKEVCWLREQVFELEKLLERERMRQEKESYEEEQMPNFEDEYQHQEMDFAEFFPPERKWHDPEAAHKIGQMNSKLKNTTKKLNKLEVKKRNLNKLCRLLEEKAATAEGREVNKHIGVDSDDDRDPNRSRSSSEDSEEIMALFDPEQQSMEGMKNANKELRAEKRSLQDKLQQFEKTADERNEALRQAEFEMKKQDFAIKKLEQQLQMLQAAGLSKRNESDVLRAQIKELKNELKSAEATNKWARADRMVEKEIEAEKEQELAREREREAEAAQRMQAAAAPDEMGNAWEYSEVDDLKEQLAAAHAEIESLQEQMLEHGIMPEEVAIPGPPPEGYEDDGSGASLNPPSRSQSPAAHLLQARLNGGTGRGGSNSRRSSISAGPASLRLQDRLQKMSVLDATLHRVELALGIASDSTDNAEDNKMPASGIGTPTISLDQLHIRALRLLEQLPGQPTDVMPSALGASLSNLLQREGSQALDLLGPEQHSLVQNAMQRWELDPHQQKDGTSPARSRHSSRRSSIVEGISRRNSLAAGGGAGEQGGENGWRLGAAVPGEALEQLSEEVQALENLRVRQSIAAWNYLSTGIVGRKLEAAWGMETGEREALLKMPVLQRMRQREEERMQRHEALRQVFLSERKEQLEKVLHTLVWLIRAESDAEQDGQESMMTGTEKLEGNAPSIAGKVNLNMQVEQSAVAEQRYWEAKAKLAPWSPEKKVGFARAQAKLMAAAAARSRNLQGHVTLMGKAKRLHSAGSQRDRDRPRQREKDKSRSRSQSRERELDISEMEMSESSDMFPPAINQYARPAVPLPESLTQMMGKMDAQTTSQARHRPSSTNTSGRVDIVSIQMVDMPAVQSPQPGRRRPVSSTGLSPSMSTISGISGSATKAGGVSKVARLSSASKRSRGSIVSIPSTKAVPLTPLSGNALVAPQESALQISKGTPLIVRPHTSAGHRRDLNATR